MDQCQSYMSGEEGTSSHGTVTFIPSEHDDRSWRRSGREEEEDRSWRTAQREEEEQEEREDGVTVVVDTAATEEEQTPQVRRRRSSFGSSSPKVKITTRLNVSQSTTETEKMMLSNVIVRNAG